MKAVLALEDGTLLEGRGFGAEGEAAGEVVFNTQVIGFQEVLTDPSYGGKLVAFGYPHFGNAGVNGESNESDSVQPGGVIVNENSRMFSNWNGRVSFSDFMKKHGTVGIEGIDTRSLTVHIRENGEMRAIVSTKDFDKESLLKKIKSQMTNDKYRMNSKSKNIKSKTVIIDIGVNNSTKAKYPGASMVSPDIKAEEIIKAEPELVVISSGPGDPREMKDLVVEIKKLAGKVKLLGIQKGACVLALALGCSVYKMKVGHHGMNQPVIDPETGKGEITLQCHSYGVEKLPAGIKAAHVNLNDRTIERFVSRDGKSDGILYFPVDERGKLDPGYRRI